MRHVIYADYIYNVH